MSILDRLEALDIETVDQLIALKEQHQICDEHLAKLQEREKDISEVVFQRIRKDYNERIASLEEKASPLKDKARHSYSDLRSLLDLIHEEREAVRYAKEEIEVRYDIGELAEKDRDQQISAVETQLEEWDQHLQKATAVQEKFLSAFESSEELESPTNPAPVSTLSDIESVLAPEEPEEPQEPQVSEVPEVPEVPEVLQKLQVPEETQEPEPLPTQESEPLFQAEEQDPTPEELNDSCATLTLSKAPAVDQPIFKPSDEESRKFPASSISAPSPKTKIMPLAFLISSEDEERYVVEPITSIGRQIDNSIRINKPSVSRYHAEIEMTEAGYVVKDLSANGTLVNRERVEGQKLLKNQDEIIFGEVVFSFQCPEKKNET